VIESLRMFGRRTLDTMRQFSPGQITAIVIGALALVAAAVLLLRVSSSPMTPLYSNLTSEDAVAITQELEAQGTPFELSAGGTQILVAPEDVSQARLAVSAAGLPANADSGYSLLDQQGMTTSEFMQNINYQRAMEGELASTIEGIEGVRSAVVHLAIPADSVFTQSSDKPSASVLVVMGGGQQLSADQVEAITNLVASSVPGLMASAVTVTDSNGTLLTGGGVTGSASVERGRRLEASMVESVQAMLDRVLGPGKATVTVKADLDFDTRSTKVQSYTYPNEIPALSSQTSTENYTSTDNSATDGPVLGEPPVVIGEGTTNDSQSEYEKTTATQTNPIDSTVTERIGAPGAIRRLTVAVLVDSAVPAETFAEVEEIVSNAVGLDTTRGDAIKVSQVAFDTSVADAAAQAATEAADAERMSTIFSIARQVGIALLVIAIMVLGAFALRRQRRTMVTLEALEARGVDNTVLLERIDGDGERVLVPIGAGGEGMEAGASDEDELPTYIQSPGSATYDTLKDFATKEPQQVARVLKTWMTS
jgi:flagellar M-ring protein FliF